MTPDDTARLELAITELKGSVDTGMARIEGRLDVLVQRAEQTDRRADGHDGAIQRLDDRVDGLERTVVTREELDAREKAAAVREQAARDRADKAAHRRLIVFGFIITAVFGSISAVIAVISMFVR